MTPAGWLAVSAAMLLAGGRASLGRHANSGHRNADRSWRRNAPRNGRGTGPGLAELAGASVAVLAIASAGLPGLVAAPVLAIVVTIAIRRHLAGRPAPPPDRRQLAFAVDLVVAVLRTGAPVERAIAAVTDAAGACGSPDLIAAVGPLRRVGRLLELGADPGAAWLELGSEPAYAGVAAAGTRCAASGARLGGALADVAIALRQERLTRALARAERVGVWSLLPLGLCFLPAFICIGVVPVVAGVAGQVLSGVPS